MRLNSLADHLRLRGLRVVTHGDWKAVGSSTFHPQGVVIHHTGPWSNVQNMVNLCIEGRADLTGPLCQVVLAPDGTCHVIASGRANHAGDGGWKGLRGNTTVAGIEAVHSGAIGTPWPSEQRQAFSRCAAAIAELIGCTAEMVCAHREWTTRKVDPVNIDMAKFRIEVAAHMAAWNKPPTPQMEVPPMINPPVDVLKIVAVLKAPSGGVWQLTEAGAIYAWECPDYGAPNRHPEYWVDRKAARLEPLGQGYTVVAATGERYDYLP